MTVKIDELKEALGLLGTTLESLAEIDTLERIKANRAIQDSQALVQKSQEKYQETLGTQIEVFKTLQKAFENERPFEIELPADISSATTGKITIKVGETDANY